MKTCGVYVLVFLTYLQIRTLTAQTDFSNDDEWDYLLFVQHWPFTVCSQWEDKSPKNNCTLPEDKALWTIHGIWPTKIGTEGPNFCNSSWHFNETQLDPILHDLEEFWMNIEANTKLAALWKHEWRKHGTCAVTTDLFNSEFDYFGQGLSWVKTYGVGNILSNSNIVPDEQGYTVEDIHNGIKRVLNKNPIIQCVVDPDTKDSLISEIRLCFDKTLNLIDCDISKVGSIWRYFHPYYDGNVILTNCNANKPVMYFKHLPVKTAICEEQPEENHKSYMEKMLQLYNVLQFLIWLSL